ncbi:RNA-directed DNA polymerase [Duganella aceris]|uniref:RNA-directed DNA polymerase n=1 Tax=Duganella aceris TaxID=2703883 RepID=A0ABX0FGX9_9BURK|nr:RNA-directed DNA polymerase [Duganella aceris]NGZ83817.1 RNA-directed DNA polymerase [Duganella aceris]
MHKPNYQIEDISSAYRKFKSLIYYDKNDLSTRIKLAKFETGLDKKLLNILDVVNYRDPCRHVDFVAWVEDIGSRIVPKGIESEPERTVEENGIFISNFLSYKKLNVKKVNYFFDGPIELQIIATLWIIHEGKYLDYMLGNECYGSRLESDATLKEESSPKLFIRYHDLYKRWRDGGIKKARQMLVEEKTSVCILGLDIQEYYYHIDFDYKEAKKIIQEKMALESSKNGLIDCLEIISKKYKSEINSHLPFSHDSDALPTGLPIGMISSPLLANWHLRKFDFEVKEKIRPSYYGRYIDDIFIVIPAPAGFSENKKPIEYFISEILVKNTILKTLPDDRYEINSVPGLYLQQKKCILQHFDINHSIAALEKFKKELEANSSDFLLLPVDDNESSLEDVAYDLLYDGSVNKFRSVKGVAENRYELAKHLARQTMLHLLTTDKFEIDTRNGLLNFFKGKNAIDFHDLWERVLTFFVVSRDAKGFNVFCKNIELEIERINFKSSVDITLLLRENLSTHLNLSKCMASTLDLNADDFDDSRNSLSGKIWTSNLIRHHFVRIPLINYTSFRGSLIGNEASSNLRLNSRKIKYSPRFVNFDECIILITSKILKYHSASSQVDYIVAEAEKLFFRINGRLQSGVEVVKEEEGSDEL